jgi:hypothetical protein
VIVGRIEAVDRFCTEALERDRAEALRSRDAAMH